MVVGWVGSSHLPRASELKYAVPNSVLSCITAVRTVAGNGPLRKEYTCMY